MSSTPHEPFKALGPINWDFGNGKEPEEEARIRKFLSKTFADAECIIDSIPADSSSAPQTGRPRSSTDPNRHNLPSRTRQPSDRARELRKDWKEVKVNPRENPLGLSVYKLTAKDGKGTWFARRSIHEGQSFEKWKLAMEKEFAESMKVKGKPGSGSIRGIGADKRVEHMVLDGCGKLEVYQLSAQFPGPTTPREFVTMLLTTDCGLEPHTATANEKPLRYFMVVSKPCLHPECAAQSGFIRGAYESVELIREVRTEIKVDPLRKVQSSIDLPADEANAIARDTMNQLAHEAPIRAARPPRLNGVPENDVEGHDSDTVVASSLGSSEQQHQPSSIKMDEEYETKIEWLMVTRSDPGGSVPRFMVEKGTPSAIAGDADKFLKWVESKSLKEFLQPDKVEAQPKLESLSTGEEETKASRPPTTQPSVKVIDECNTEREPVYEEDTPAYTGLYGIIAGAIGAAATMIPTFGSNQGDTSPEISPSTGEDDDDRSSIRTFHSFVTGQESPDEEPREADVQLSRTTTNGEDQSLHSSTESTATHSFNASSSQHEKELRKLEERKRKMDERFQRSQARALAKRNHEGASNDEDLLVKLREKHEREVAKQTEKYQRELRKLEAKRHNEQRKAEERRRKQAEREEKANLTMELEKVRAERDVARKQIEVLKEQVGELQAQNTMLVARLGREGITLDTTAGGITGILSSDLRRRGSPAPGGGGGSGKISRASTVLGTPSQSSTSPISGPPKGDRPPRDSRVHLQTEGIA